MCLSEYSDGLYTISDRHYSDDECLSYSSHPYNVHVSVCATIVFRGHNIQQQL